jgi:hypothetical protein
LFDPAREGFLDGSIDWDTAVIRVSPVRGYTFSASHKFVSDLTGAGGTIVVDGSSTAYALALAGKGVTNGIAYATDPTFTAVPAGSPIPGFAVYQASAVTGGSDVAATAQRLIAWYDGTFSVTAAATSEPSATTVVVDPLASALAAGSMVVFGGVTATLTGSASRGDRSLTVSALSGGVTVDTVGTTSAQGNLPITPNGGDITPTMPTTGNRWFRL